MPEYKRLVSYMYNYEDGVKRNNVGYARVEARNGQCKFTLHITAPSLNDKQLRAYVFKRKTDGMEGVLLGAFQIRNGNGDFKIVTDSLHIMSSPYGIQDMGGIVLYLSERKYFATEWDDAPVTMSMVADIAKVKPVSEEKSMKAANVGVVLEEPSEDTKEKMVSDNENQQEDEDRGLLEETDEKTDKISDNDDLKELLNPSFENILEEVPEDKVLEKLEPETKDKPEQSPSSKAPKVEDINDYKDRRENQNQPETQPKNAAEAENSSVENLLAEDKKETKESQGTFETDTAYENKKIENDPVIKDETDLEEDKESEKIPPPVESTAPPKVNEQEEGKAEPKSFFDDHPLAKQIYRSFPRMYPFEDNEIAWCVRIEPKDIGLLPMDSWTLGNNSFLLHGYYSYRHLIFARINDKNGMNYILGVPGIYHNREKFMAKMFGFENFKCAKRKAQRTGEFGYWYIPISLN